MTDYVNKLMNNAWGPIKSLCDHNRRHK
jgi:hypothetical protein